ncbi:hypothetical protein MNBD_PLANCTO03-2442, partial [hydrothermal vent metagenome]
VRRSMAEYNQRYTSAYEMYADLEAALNADDMFAVMPADLPSVKGGVDASAHDDPTPDEATRVIAAGSPVAPGRANPAATPAADHAAASPAAPVNSETPGDRSRPRLSLVNWWTGSYAARPGRPAPAAGPAGGDGNEADGWRPWRDGDDEPLINKSIHRDQFAPADEQLRRARQRAKAAQQRVNRKRSQARRSRGRRDPNSRQLNAGVAIALFVFLGASVFLAGGLIFAGASNSGQQADSAQPERLLVDNNDGISITLNNDGLDSLKFMEDLKGLGGDLEGLREIPTQIVEALAQAGIYDRDRGVISIEDEGNRITIKAPEWFLAGDASETAGDSRATAQAHAQTQAASQAPSSGSVLVINDLRDSADDATSEAIDRGLDRLASLGYSIVGLGVSDEDIELTASAKKAIELGTADDQMTIEKLKAWLKGSDGALQGLVWISRDSPAGNPLVLMRGKASERRKIERLFRS